MPYSVFCFFFFFLKCILCLCFYFLVPAKRAMKCKSFFFWCMYIYRFLKICKGWWLWCFPSIWSNSFGEMALNCYWWKYSFSDFWLYSFRVLATGAHIFFLSGSLVHEMHIHRWNSIRPFRPNMIWVLFNCTCTENCMWELLVHVFHAYSVFLLSAICTFTPKSEPPKTGSSLASFTERHHACAW